MDKTRQKKAELGPRDKLFGRKKAELLGLLEASIKRNAPKGEFGILFSGGVDSALLALLCKRLGLRFTCFFGFVKGFGEAKDLAFAEKAAKEIGVKLEIASIEADFLPKLIAETVPLTGSANPVQVGVSIPLAIACRKASEAGIKTVFSGMGADEMFCGYAKFRASKSLALDSMKLVNALPENDLRRDNAIASRNGLQLRTPFLNAEILKFALSLPKSMKLSAKGNKIILRALAEDLGLSPELARRKKVAAQYGSNADKAVEKLAKKAKAKTKTAYIESLLNKPGIAALFSGGKDSCLALWKMQSQGFEVKCLVSILPKNPDSFMYHQPDLKILGLQSKALGIPLVTERTPGVKEKELSALRKALLRAKKDYAVKGVVSGALYSEYQRKRIQKICDALKLELFSPLWHVGQLEELHELVNRKFLFVFSKVAGLGMGREWLGKPIGVSELIELEALNKTQGFNVAGEGGEFESIVLNAPNFAKRIIILKAEKKMQNEFTGLLEVKQAVLD